MSETALDANESSFFLRETEHIKAKTYDVKYPEFKADRLIPVSNEAGPGAQSITYRQYDEVGVAKIIADYADDLPRVDVKAKEFSVIPKSLGDSYGFNINEIRAAAKAGGPPLQQRKANTARRAIDQLMNIIAWVGDTIAGLTGLLNHPNITTGLAPNDGTGASRNFSAKTPAQIVRDFSALVNGVRVLTKGVEEPDTALFPLSVWTDISTRQNSAASDVTILQYLKSIFPTITTWEWLLELDTAGAGSTKAIMVYKRDVDHLTQEVPQPFEQFEPEKRNLEWVTDCHARVAGVIIYYPLSVSRLDDV